MKGVSEVIAIILILMITITIAGLAYMFMSTTMSDVTSSAGSTVDTTTSSMLTSFTIESMDIAKVYVRNTGQNALTSLSVYVNDEPATFNVTTPISAGAVGTITIYSFIPDGATVKIMSPSGFSTSKVSHPCSKAVACWDFDNDIGANILVNGDLETDIESNGVPDGWANDPGANGAYTTEYSRSSSHSVKIFNYSGDGAWHKSVSGIATGRQYMVSGWIKTNGVPLNDARGAKVMVGWKNSTGWVWSNWAASTILRGDNDWTWLTVSAPAPQTATEVVILFYGPAAGSAWADDLEISEIQNVYDSSNNGITGTINGSTFSEGKYGNALLFDGVNDYVNVGDIDSLDFGAGDFSVASWAYIKPFAVNTMIVSKSSSGWFSGYYLGIDNTSNTYYMRFGAGNGTENGIVNNYVNITAYMNGWHYFVGVKSGNTLKLFIDGRLTDTDSGFFGSVSTSNPCGIGARVSTSSMYFNGTIDEVRIYNRAIY